MAYEFKKLSDVDIVETPSETANVLIEEDGVIKKAPKTAVGGGGGSSNEYDMIIQAELSSPDAILHLIKDSDYKVILAPDYNTIVNKIEQGIKPKISLSYLYKDQEFNYYSYTFAENNAYISLNIEDKSVALGFKIDNLNPSLLIYKNNSFHIQWPPV